MKCVLCKVADWIVDRFNILISILIAIFLFAVVLFLMSGCSKHEVILSDGTYWKERGGFLLDREAINEVRVTRTDVTGATTEMYIIRDTTESTENQYSAMLKAFEAGRVASAPIP